MARETLLQILDLARWAPSGDNTQPWRFEVKSDDRIVVHGFDTREHCVYDIDGRPSQVAIGALLENIAVAATAHGLDARITRDATSPEEAPRFDVLFLGRREGPVDPLHEQITKRSVQRRPLAMQPLTDDHKTSLEAALGASTRVIWLEGLTTRLNVAGLLWQSAKIRLTIPEAYSVHRSVIAWGNEFSEDRVPDRAIGLDPLGLKLMAWVMQSWGRVQFFNTFLGGTFLPRLQLDLLPGLFCGAHFALVTQQKPKTIDDFVAAGRAMQRFWLTATRLGLQLQPEMTPLIFSEYARQGKRFTEVESALARARSTRSSFAKLLGEENASRVNFFGRIGYGSGASARSTRLPLNRLMVDPTRIAA